MESSENKVKMAQTAAVNALGAQYSFLMRYGSISPGKFQAQDYIYIVIVEY